jgi:hypothetical protein
LPPSKEAERRRGRTVGALLELGLAGTLHSWDTEARVAVRDGAIRWLDAVVRIRRASGRPVGRMDDIRVKRVSVVVSDGRAMHIVGGDAQPAKVVRRTFVMAILQVIEMDCGNVRTRGGGDGCQALQRRRLRPVAQLALAGCRECGRGMVDVAVETRLCDCSCSAESR